MFFSWVYTFRVPTYRAFVCSTVATHCIASLCACLHCAIATCNLQALARQTLEHHSPGSSPQAHASIDEKPVGIRAADETRRQFSQSLTNGAGFGRNRQWYSRKECVPIFNLPVTQSAWILLQEVCKKFARSLQGVCKKFVHLASMRPALRTESFCWWFQWSVLIERVSTKSSNWRFPIEGFQLRISVMKPKHPKKRPPKWADKLQSSDMNKFSE